MFIGKQCSYIAIASAGSLATAKSGSYKDKFGTYRLYNNESEENTVYKKDHDKIIVDKNLDTNWSVSVIRNIIVTFLYY